MHGGRDQVHQRIEVGLYASASFGAAIADDFAANYRPLFANRNTTSCRIGPLQFAGVALWTIGFLFEAIADWQLARFKGNAANSGRVLDHGLWRYSRHPNYFGNACLWWGLWLIACDHLVGLATVFAPILMTHFLLNVTGKKLLEKRMSSARPEYAAYIARTPGFFPWFPRGF